MATGEPRRSGDSGTGTKGTLKFTPGTVATFVAGPPVDGAGGPRSMSWVSHVAGSAPSSCTAGAKCSGPGSCRRGAGETRCPLERGEGRGVEPDIERGMVEGWGGRRDSLPTRTSTGVSRPRASFVSSSSASRCVCDNRSSRAGRGSTGWVGLPGDGWGWGGSDSASGSVCCGVKMPGLD
jgi:hypothetical protein